MLADQEQSGQPRHVAQIRRAKTTLEQDSTVSEGQSYVSDAAVRAASHPTSLASFCPVLGGGSNINIVCCWSAIVGKDDTDETFIHGQHHLRNLLVRPLKKSKSCPLALTAKYKPRIFHNFDEGPLVSARDILHIISF
jgi:hypothetical protein